MASLFTINDVPLDTLYETFPSGTPTDLVNAFKLDLMNYFNESNPPTFVQPGSLKISDTVTVPIWGKPAESQNKYKKNGESISFTSKNTTVFPSNGHTFAYQFTRLLTKQYYIRWKNSKLYFVGDNNSEEEISDKSLVIIDFQAGGGDGSSGQDTDYGMYGGAGGGGGSFCRVLLDFSECKELTFLLNNGSITLYLKEKGGKNPGLVIGAGKSPIPPSEKSSPCEIKGGLGGSVIYRADRTSTTSATTDLASSYELGNGKLYILDTIAGGAGGKSYYKEDDDETAGSANYNGGSGGNVRGHIKFGMNAYYPAYPIWRDGGVGKSFASEDITKIGGGGGGACALYNGIDANTFQETRWGAGGAGFDGIDEGANTLYGRGGIAGMIIYT